MTDLSPPSDAPAEAPPPAPNRGARLAIALVALAVVVALVAGVVVVTSGDDGGDDEAPPTTEPAAPAEDPPAGEDPRALEEAVAELSAFVEQRRGRPFVRPVDVELLADEEFVERLRAQEDDEQEVEETARLLRAVGLLEADDDLQAAIDEVTAEGVAGFYDPEEDALVVRGSEVSPAVRSTLVHELTHAWDDQHFELHRPQLREADDESAFGFSALVEGNAEAVEQSWAAQLPADERDEVEASQDEAGGLEEADIPEVVLQLIALPYVAGPDLIAGLLAAGGVARVDAAFEAPPTTSEQVLDPTTYIAAPQPAVPVPDPPADGEVEDEGVFGAAGVLITLADAVSEAAARRSAAGWGGDRYVTWADGDRTCVRVAVVGDTPADTSELRDAWTQWAGAQDDARVEDAEGRVVVTSCA
jgi:hypothetical protein